MGLQVRVRHALGERLIELPDRPADNPVVVGRASDADVQVPSVSVAPRHCALFQFEGHWVVQNVGGSEKNGNGTLVNGEPVGDPVHLHIGDVISIGSDASAPTIEVDPLAAADGHSGWAGDGIAAVAVAPAAYPGGPNASGGYDPGATAGAFAAPGHEYGHGYGYAAPAPSPGHGPAVPTMWSAAATMHADHAHEHDDHAAMADAATSAAGTSRSSYSRGRRPQNKSSAGIVIGVVATIVIVGGASLLAYVKSRPDPVVQKPPTRKEPEQRKPNSIFDMDRGAPTQGEGPATPGRTPTPRPENGSPTPPPVQPVVDPGPKPPVPTTPVPPTPTPSTEPAAPPADPIKPPSEPVKPPTPTPGPGPTPPEMQDSPPPAVGAGTWDEMENLRATPTHPGIAIVRFDDFRRNHPGVHEAELEQYMDEKFDLLWWQRLDGLFKKRDRLTGEMTKIRKALPDENDPESKKKMIADFTQKEKEVKQVNAILRETMGYAEERPPDLGNKQDLAQLREKRDKGKYTSWKKTTFKSLKDRHGTPPWAGDV